ncbi:hypothetical protein PsorP6_012008 [Peronosclerospora sorghi]|uniref:Uncharacterized protein n=1 Tax=Peronosclerospora sorghi TaxID=230839 RepID=A0ACC0WLU3_9STRA|nr:hypothetical protein PsorP6_012008 [Peronosclerospora sorghi]
MVPREHATTFLAPLPFILRLCSLSDLRDMSQVSRDVSAMCEHEWRLRTLLHFGDVRFHTSHWRRCFLLRSRFRRNAVDEVTARVYLMNNRGELRFFSTEKGTPLMCSRDRALIYNRCKTMFDYSLRLNRSIQELSTLIGLVSVDEARRLLNEHIGLMTSVTALRELLHFESDLFPLYPAPVLLDTNALLRVTHKFHAEQNAAFLASSLLMMQLWVSIDGLIYRPLAPPEVIQKMPNHFDHHEDHRTQYASMKLQELAGMTVDLDDNTLRYRMQGDELCVNALVSNAYLLYLFNPLHYRPLDWTFDAYLQVGDTVYQLPRRREGAFLNTKTYALRLFLSYGKRPCTTRGETTMDTMDERGQAHASAKLPNGLEGAETSFMKDIEERQALTIPCNGQHEIIAFRLTATNRISKKTCVVASEATCVSLARAKGDASHDETASRSLERQVPLPYDAVISYYFAPSCCLEYVEFAIGFESLMHLLGIAEFLAKPVRPT